VDVLSVFLNFVKLAHFLQFFYSNNYLLRPTFFQPLFPSALDTVGSEVFNVALLDKLFT